MMMLLLLLVLVMMMPLRHCREHLLTNRVGHRRHFDVSVCPLKCIPVGFLSCDFACGRAATIGVLILSLDVDLINLLARTQAQFCDCYLSLYYLVIECGPIPPGRDPPDGQIPGPRTVYRFGTAAIWLLLLSCNSCSCYTSVEACWD